MATQPVVREDTAAKWRSVTPRITQLLSMLPASMLLDGLSPIEAAEVLKSAHSRAIGKNELLFMQGRPPGHLMLVEYGLLKLTQCSANWTEAILWLSGAGDVVGICGVLNHGNHSCSARVLVNSRALVWDHEKVQRILAETPQIRKNMARILSLQLSELEERFREVSTENVERRVALALLRVVHQIGIDRHPWLEA